MTFTIDRIEGDWAICERSDREIVRINKYILPFLAAEGVIFEIVDGVFRPLQDNVRKERIKNLMDELFTKKQNL